MERKRVIVMSGIFMLCLSLLCVHVYADFKRKKSERIKLLIREAELSLSNLGDSK